jgi:hypothetical protein
MKFVVKSVLAAVVVCSMTDAAWAADGVLIVQQTTTASGPRTNQVQIAKDRMRAEVSGPAGATQVVIFDATKQVIDIVNVERKTYTEMTKADLDNMAAQAQQMMSQVQATMANLPPAQRAQIEAMMAARGMGAGASAVPAKIEYRKTGTDHVAKWNCDKYDVYRGPQKTSEVCTVSPAVLGLAAGDIDVMRQLGQFFKQIAAQASTMFDLGQANDPGFIGVPVRSVMTVAGQPITTELTDVSHQTFADSLFVVPDGFQKEDMMRGRGRGRQ